MYESNKIAERIKDIAKNKGIVLKEMLKETELGKNTLSSMVAGSFPKADNLARIADYLGCSVDYLLGREPQTPTQSNVDNSLTLSEKEKAVVLAYRSHPEMQKAVDTLLNVPPVNDIPTDMANVMAKGEEIFGKMRTKVK